MMNQSKLAIISELINYTQVLQISDSEVVLHCSLVPVSTCFCQFPLIPPPLQRFSGCLTHNAMSMCTIFYSKGQILVVKQPEHLRAQNNQNLSPGTSFMKQTTFEVFAFAKHSSKVYSHVLVPRSGETGK